MYVKLRPLRVKVAPPSIEISRARRCTAASSLAGGAARDSSHIILVEFTSVAPISSFSPKRQIGEGLIGEKPRPVTVTRVPPSVGPPRGCKDTIISHRPLPLASRFRSAGPPTSVSFCPTHIAVCFLRCVHAPSVSKVPNVETILKIQ